MEPHLQLHPGQQALTPEQKAEARRFAREWVAVQLSTEPIDEPEAESFLRQAYAVTGLTPPQQIHWVDGPLQLVAALALQDIKTSVEKSVRTSVWESVGHSLQEPIGDLVWASVRDNVHTSVYGNVWENVGDLVEANVWESGEANTWEGVKASVRAYGESPDLAFLRFFDTYLAPNAMHALAHLNVRVSGYWLGQEVAILLHRPRVLSRDAAGRLHSATGTCLEYRDGWGFYAWHGVLVLARVILAPDSLTRDDFLSEPDLEVRRVIQERMGDRFVPELGGQLLDEGPRGRLYEVPLPDDPERIAHYVQVQDASTPRQYFLRVPPTIQTAAEAVAWSFQLAVQEYGPAHET